MRYRKGRVSPGTLSVCFILCIAMSQGELIGDCSKELGKKAAERWKRTEKIRFRGVITAKPVLLQEKGGGV